MAKKFDFKEFMLEKGERVGLGVAAGLMVLMAGIGAYGGFTRESPADTVKEIQTNAGTIETTLLTGPPLSPTEVDKGTLVPVANDVLNPKDNLFPTDLSIGEGANDNKRRNPEVPVPNQFHIEPFRAQVENYIITGTPPNLRIGVLISKDKLGDKDKPTQVDPRQLGNRWTGPAPAAAPGRPGYTQDAYGRLVQITQDESGGTTDKYVLKFVDIKDKETPNAKYAKTVHPLRMVILTASFPYKKELDSYVKALKPGGAIKDLIGTKDLPTFEPCKVRRRIVPPVGKPGPWEEVKLEDIYRPVLQMSVGTQKESKDLEGVIFQKSPLVMYLPQLARGDYPSVGLENIRKTADELKAKAASGEKPPVISPLQAKLTGSEGFSVYNPVTAPGEKADDPKVREARTGEDAVIPEYCLIRLVDTDPKLKPSTTYQYQIKVRLANPNFGMKDKVAFEDLASKASIESDWAPEEKEIKKLGTEVTIPREMYFYATEMDDKLRTLKEKSDSKLISDRADVAYLQAQEWFESIQLNPTNSATKVPLGDWAITEIPVRRGEFIARRENVEVPVWVPTREGFEFAIPVMERRPMGGGKPAPGIPVDFGPKEPSNLELLVDYEGGRVEQSFKVGDKAPRNVREEAPLEILVMSADGTLRVQNSRQDAKDPDRERRTADIKKFQDDVRKKSKVGGGTKDPLAPK